ncbi:MAG TPA: mechanosensitive ion channel domain-containing protein, partial [Candidatus Sulfotelmatobacter sp.]|nr:mechanosensitive ion channel domain-containing protein [Candidatus Sulfotelmatobacter sp.]
PLRRDSPQDTVLNFVKYSHRGDYATAAEYLELPTARQKQEGPELARKLLILMNTSFQGSISSLSSAPEGFLDDSSDPNIEVAGRLTVQDKSIQCLLVRVSRKDTGPIWLISHLTLDQVRELYELSGAPPLDQYLPEFLSKNLILGIPAGRWLAWVASVPMAWLLGWGVVILSRWIWSIRRQPTPLIGQQQGPNLGTPAAIAVAIVLHGLLVFATGLPLFYRVYYMKTLAVLLTLTLAWLGVRVLDRVASQAMFRIARGEAQSFMQIGHQILKLAWLALALLCILALLGFDTRTMLAGLGIGGIAVALAAQKTLENLLGGITLVMDKAMYVGDDCLIAGRYVNIRDIGLRSVVAVTREGTEIFFPNGMLIQNNIENLSRRRKFLILTTLSLSTESSIAQLEYVIVKVREMLYSHSRVEQESARFRLAGLQGSAYQIELFAYVMSNNAAEFAAIQEDILFRITGVAESAGTAWAIPAQTAYSSTKRRIDDQKAEQVIQQLQTWQDSKEKVFPDFSSQRMTALRGTIGYPDDKPGFGREEPTPLQRPVREAV